MPHFVLLVLISYTIHRLWIYESIFQKHRLLVERTPLKSMLLCPPCFALWSTVLAEAFLWLPAHPVLTSAAYVLAGYAPISLALQLLPRLTILEPVVPPRPVGRARPMPAVKAMPINEAAEAAKAASRARAEERRRAHQAAPPARAKADCGICGQKSAAQSAVAAYEKRIVIMTALASFESSYSLVSAIIDQARMLALNPKWLVQVWVMQTANDRDWPKDMPANVELRKIIPAVPFVEDVIDPKGQQILLHAMRRELVAMGNATVITHDLLFISWYVTFAAAIHEFADLRGFEWFHIGHSAPSGRPSRSVIDAKSVPSWPRYTLPAGEHTIVALAECLRSGFGITYEIPPDRIKVWPNARDPRTMGMHPMAVRITTEAKLWEGGVVQVYPISSTRFEAKGLSKLLRAFAALAVPWKLVIANPHANGTEGQNAVLTAQTFASTLGIPAGRLFFTSEMLPETAATGLPGEAVRDLFRYANIFAFPTFSEASSLILMEAAIAGLPLVLNAAVPSLREIYPVPDDQLVDWGTNTAQGQDDSTARRAAGIMERLHATLPAKTHVLRSRSLESVASIIQADLGTT